jgi:hypothetical protein
MARLPSCAGITRIRFSGRRPASPPLSPAHRAPAGQHPYPRSTASMPHPETRNAPAKPRNTTRAAAAFTARRETAGRRDGLPRPARRYSNRPRFLPDQSGGLSFPRCSPSLSGGRGAGERRHLTDAPAARIPRARAPASATGNGDYAQRSRMGSTGPLGRHPRVTHRLRSTRGLADDAVTVPVEGLVRIVPGKDAFVRRPTKASAPASGSQQGRPSPRRGAWSAA